jgi:outer membrane receptor protein involved in Fe transport
MRKKRLKVQSVWIVLFLFLPTFILFAGETGKIAGKVLDKETGDPLAGANIQISGTLLGSAVNLDGEYFIINIPPGTYELRCTFVGYKEEVITTVRVFIDKTTRVDFQMSEQVLLGEAVVVTAYRPDEVEVDLTATRQTYDVSEIENLPGMSDVSDIIDLQADVDGSHFRGGRSGEASFLVGGATIVNPLTNQSTFDPMTIALEQVEVYTSGFSAEYGNAQSGVVNMVTKEGGSQWETRLEFSTTNSYDKTWGGSVYSPDYLDFYDMMYGIDEWLDGTDPTSGRILWAENGIDFPDNYLPPEPPPTWPPSPGLTREDTLRTATLSRTLWLQAMRDVGLEYAKPDYRFFFSVGGPLFQNATLFFAAHQNQVNPIIPTSDGDLGRQVMSNIVYRLGTNNKFKLSYLYNHQFENNITSNFFRWSERATNVNKVNETIQQFGFGWNYVYSNATVMDLKINQLNTSEKDRNDLLSPLTDEYAPGQFSNDYTNDLNWRDYSTPAGYQVGKINTSSGDRKTKTLNIAGSITSQVNIGNLLKSGFQFFYYDIDIDHHSGATNRASLRMDKYRVYPYEGAIYFQDKMEFTGFIANLGLRYDFYDLNTKYYTNKFSPYRNPNFNPDDPDQGGYYDQENAPTEETKFTSVLQPRLGFSFPVSAKTVLHLNYGVFTQRPAFEYIFIGRYSLDANPNFERLGNPQLKPEKTISYDIGVVQALPLGFYLELSAYLKNVSNLVQLAYYTDKDGFVYQTFDNREYADIKGFHINLEKRYGFLRGFARYNWESATGKSSSPLGAADRVVHYENESQKDQLRDPKDINLDFNRKHKLVVNLSYQTPSHSGLEIFNLYPFALISLSGTYRYSSGRPFTWDQTGQGLRFNQRTPNENDLSFRLEKGFEIGMTTLTAYFEAFNVLNSKTYHYSRTFSEDPQNRYRARWADYNINGILTEEEFLTDVEFAPYVMSLDGYLIANQPRHYRFGIIFKF